MPNVKENDIAHSHFNVNSYSISIMPPGAKFKGPNQYKITQVSKCQSLSELCKASETTDAWLCLLQIR